MRQTRLVVVFAIVSMVVSSGSACFDAGDDSPAPGDDVATADALADGTTDDTRGSCPAECSAPEAAGRVVAECVAGSCELRCEQGWSDGDDNLENGCERVEGCSPSNGGVETCDGRDNDCDGETDEDAEDATEWFRDADGDGFGDVEETERACDKPDGFVSNKRDCDDSDAQVRPREFFPDRDGDGFTTNTPETKCSGPEAPEGFARESSEELDCDDDDVQQNPSVAEVCDGEDTNCDGQTDNIPQDGSQGTQFFIDCDGDEFSPGSTGSLWACSEPSSGPTGCSTSNPTWTDKAPTTDDKTDCNDDAPNAHPQQSSIAPGASFFDSPTKNAGSDRLDRWDYNCDGFVEKRWGDTSCDSGSTSDCSCNVVTGPEGGGFTDAARPVDCGQSGDFIPCECDNASSCGLSACTFTCGSTTTETQECK